MKSSEFIKENIKLPASQRPWMKMEEEEELDEISRRDFLKGAGATIGAAALGSNPAQAQSNSDPLYLTWYCYSLSKWMTPQQQAMLKKVKADMNNPRSDRMREEAGHDALKVINSASRKYGADSSESDKDIAEHARKALQELYWATGN